jgi:hypothetical protein
MNQVGFQPTIPVLERAKTVLALDRAATVIGTGTTFRNLKHGYRSYLQLYLLGTRMFHEITSKLHPAQFRSVPDTNLCHGHIEWGIATCCLRVVIRQTASPE